MKRRFLFCMTIMFLCRPVAAQLPDLFRDRFTTDNGLCSNEVFCITQDHAGFIWLGTGEGLDRYDGYAFTHFKFEPKNPDSLSNNDVRTVMEDREGRLWVGTYSGGLCRLDSSRRRWTRYRHNVHDPGSVGSDRILSICQDRAGNIWIGAWGGGLQRYDAQRDRFIGYRHDEKKPNSLCSDNISAIYEDRQGLLWIATDNGLARFDPARGTWTTYRENLGDANSISGNTVTRVHQDCSGIFWIATYGRGLNRFDPSANRWIRYRYQKDQADGLQNDIIFSITEDERGQLWLGIGTNGINMLDPRRNQWTFIPEKEEVTINWIECVFIDRGGVAWIGTGLHGVYRYPVSWRRWSYFPNLPGPRKGSAQTHVWALVEDRQGDIWAGIEKTGIWHYSGKEKTWQPFPARSRNAAPAEAPDIYALLEDHQGNLWAGLPGGMAHIDKIRNRLIPYRYRQGYPMLDTNCLAEDRDGTIWLGSKGNGLFAFNRITSSWIRYGSQNELCGDSVADLLVDSDGDLWIGTDKGLAVISRGKRDIRCFRHQPLNPDSISSDQVIFLAEDNKGGIWMSTANGLNRYDRRQGRWQRFGIADGLPTDEFYMILCDDGGRGWITMRHGLLRLDPATKAFKIYSRPDGINAINIRTSAHFKDHAGVMYMGLLYGLFRFQPREIRDNPVPPPLAITSCKINEAPWPLNEGRSPAGCIELRHWQNSLAFEFVALDFTWPKKNRYAYQLQGHDRDWIQCGNRRFVSYTNLPPGRYEFHVVAANSDGVWNREGTTLAFVIAPPFWMHWWFYLLAASTFALLSHAILLFVRRHFFLLTFWKKKNYIGRYRLIRPIGAGSMATVYLAQPLLSKHKYVAIKVLREECALNSVLRKRFRLEGAIIDQIDHPNIVKFFERGRQDETLYIVMEYLEGRTLADRLKLEEKVALGEWLGIMMQLADVLAKIHGRGIIHRDLKPANVMLCGNGTGPIRVKVLDFGLARLQLQTNLTEWGGLLGTLPYMAPEQVSISSYIPAGDIYALGMISYEALTGHHPFAQAEAHEVMQWIIHHSVQAASEVAPGIPEVVSRLLMRMIDREPSRRPDAAALLVELRVLTAG